MKKEANDINNYKMILKKAADKISELNNKLNKLNGEIAVIGYGCRFPGGANSPNEFWELLSEGFDAVTEIPSDRFEPEPYYQPGKDSSGKMSTKFASFMDGDIKSFDNMHFDILAKEAASIDPQHKLLLEVSWEALEDAGLDIPKLKGSKTGVFIGAESFDYACAEFLSSDAEDITPYTLFGVMPTSASGRLSYFYDFKGPAITCDTACSSSLAAFNIAVDSLQKGQCDLAIVGGVNLILGPKPFVGLSQIQALSPDGRCKVFDASADGFGRGEGCGIVILKRAADALRDKNTISALVKSIVVGQDGRSNGFFAPNGDSEAAVLKAAIKNSGLGADDIDYIETHGTGTPLGDYIETQSIEKAYSGRSQKMLIGSVKSNFGHLEAASGIASLIKVLLALKYQQLPPSIHFKNPNTNINWESLQVVSQLTPWSKKSGKLRAGISSFGISGTLAHLIIEQPDLVEPDYDMEQMPCQILTLSAKSDWALKESMTRMADFLNTSDQPLHHLTRSTNYSKSYLNYRYAAVASNKEALLKQLEEALQKDNVYQYNSNKIDGRPKKVAFLFTGQGSIYQNIAKDFYQHSTVFKTAMEECAVLFSEYLDVSILDAIWAEDLEILKNPIYSQPIIFAVEYSLTKIWDTAGVKPELVIGHSIGEYTAACYAGVITFEDAVKMIVLRAKLMSSVPPDGKMAGILVDEDTIREVIKESGCQKVSVAAVNAPKNVTISGNRAEVDLVIAKLQDHHRTFITDLQILHPYHSCLMETYEQSYYQDLDEIKFAKPKIKIISTISGKQESVEVLGRKDYWSSHLSHTVHFYAAVQEAKKAGINTFIEIGGNATLCGLGEQCIPSDNNLFVPSLRSGVGDYQQLFTSIKQLYLHGISIDWPGLYSHCERIKVDLPNYPFQRKQLWKELRTAEEGGDGKSIGKDKEEEKIMVTEHASETAYQKILSEVIEIVHIIAGMEYSEIDPDKELFAFGFDSLLMASLGKQVNNKYKIEVSMDKLFTVLNTLSKIASFIADNYEFPQSEDHSDKYQNIPMPAVTSFSNQVPSAEAASVYQASPQIQVNSDGLKIAYDIFKNQFDLLRDQNRIFSQMIGIHANPVMSLAPHLPETVNQRSVENHQKKTETTSVSPNYYIPYKKIRLTETQSMDQLQYKYLKNIEEKYNNMTRNSKQLTQKFRSVYASNRNSSGFRPLFKEMLYQIIAKKANGSKLIDADGNELIDLTMGFGVNMFGHNPPFVEKALYEEIGNGMPLGPMGRLPGTVAEQISDLTGVERVFFCNSGTEADMFAVRIARAVTKKNKIVCFNGAFHGTYDGFLGISTFSDNVDQAAMAMAPGITENAVKDLIVLDFNSPESLEYIRKHKDVIAAVLTEPVQSRRPDVQPREFLQELRKVTEESGIALIFDEIITGFRISSGGAQEYFGVKADIVTYGKVIGGGMPIGIVSGKAKYLNSIDGGMWNFGDDSVPPCENERTFVAGTFCHHPLAMAATNAVLTHIQSNKDSIYQELNGKTERFAKVMNEYFDQQGVPLHINHFASLFRFNITLDKEIFYYGLLEKGIYVWEGRNCFFSTEHSDKDIEILINAVKKTVQEMKAAGYFGGDLPPDDPKKKDNLAAEELPMSVIQQRLYTHMLMTESDPYDIVSAYRLTAVPEIDKIEQAVSRIIQRHEILRTIMYIQDGEYKQKIMSKWEFHVKIRESTSRIPLNELISKSICKFDLSQAPLLEVLVINSYDSDQILVFHFHHTVADGMSMDLFTREFFDYYHGHDLPDLPYQYRDFVKWEHQYLASERLSEDRSYWLKNLANIPKVTAIPYDFPEPLETVYPGHTVTGKINPNTLSALKKVARESSVSLYMLLLSALNLLIYKSTGESDIAIMTPVTNRFEGGFEENIGMFTNTIIIKNKVSNEQNIPQLLSSVKEQCIQAYRHTNYPYSHLVTELNIVGKNIFSTEFVYENVNSRSADQTGLSMQTIEFIPNTQETDLTFELLESDGMIDVYLRYRTDLFNEESINQLMTRFMKVIYQMVEHPAQKIADIKILTSLERQCILCDFNKTSMDYPVTMTLAEAFAEQVKNTPDQAAVVFREHTLTYQELDRKASVLGQMLQKMGICRNEFVAITAERSIEMVIAILGVLKAGGAYVPIDPDYPQDRIQYMLEDCQAKVIVTYGCSIETAIAGIALEQVDWDQPSADCKLVNQPIDLAYCIYTSGTTGKPKGVLVEHQNVMNLSCWFHKQYDLLKHKNVLQMTRFTFDVSVEEIIVSLLNGATVHILPEEVRTSPSEFVEFMRRNTIHIAQFVPTTLKEYLLEADRIPSLSVVICGGEKLENDLRKHILQKGYSLYNHYGPTEITVDAITCRCEPDEDIIGRPISNTRVYIINKNNEIQPPGLIGEICIAGDGVTRGYLNRPDLTAEKFVMVDEVGEIVYTTGDIGKWTPDGKIVYLGRIDEQIKIRGFRIELGEIESVIKGLKNVSDAAVIAKRDSLGETMIAAYLVSGAALDLSWIKLELEKVLPNYMIPAHLMQLDQLPLSHNGKLDKAALPEIQAKSKKEYLPPQNKQQETLAALFQEILGIEQVGINDDFFELGGHSLRATRLVNRIEVATGIKISLKQMFVSSTVEKIDRLLCQKGSAAVYSIPHAVEKEYYQMSSSQKRLYLISQMNANQLAYHMPAQIKLWGDLDIEKLTRALSYLIDRHEILRTRFLMVDGCPVQQILPQAVLPFEYIVDEKTPEEQLMKEFVCPFALDEAPLFRVKIVQRQDCHLLLIDTHHIISDGMSLETFTKEFSSLYNGVSLKELTHQFKDYSEWMLTRDLSNQQQYWLNQFSDEIPVLDLPLDFVRPQERTYHGGVVKIVTGIALGQQIEQLAENDKVTPYMIFLSSVMVLLSKYSRQEDIVIGTGMSGRTHIDTESMIGMFVNTLAMRGKPEGVKTYRDFLEEIKDVCLKAFENQEFPYEELIEQLNIKRDISRNPLFDVMMAYQNNEKEDLHFSGLSQEYTEFESNMAKFDLSFDLMADQENGFVIELEYNKDLLTEETVNRMLDHYLMILNKLTINPETILENLPIITADEEKLILNQFNNTATAYPKQQTVIELFESQVQLTPHNTAVIYQHDALTYLELNEKANALAYQLIDAGVNQNDTVGISAEKSIEVIIGICAILKAGGIYVPIDLGYPAERIEYLIEDSNPKVILTLNQRIESDRPSITMKQIRRHQGIKQNPVSKTTPDDLVYLIYTSGTTGKPKGAMICNYNVIRLVRNTNYVELNKQSLILQTGSLSFDASTFEIWGALLNGGAFYLVENEVFMNVALLSDAISSHHVNTMFITTALFNQFVDEDVTVFAPLKYLLFGGEKVSEKHVRAFMDKGFETNLIHCYGPTENTTFTTTYKVPKDFTCLPIGMPISNTQVYVMDEAHNLCGIGVPGELYAYGDGVGKGYLNQPVLTAEKFIQDNLGNGYRTGDLVRWMADGTIDFLGRIDEQVKIHGFRIELKEIEHVMKMSGEIVDCAVIVKEDGHGNKALHSYFIAPNQVDLAAFREKLGKRLPHYMIPGYMMQIDKLPVNRNGKLDRQALPEIAAKAQQQYELPQNEREEILCEAFREILGVERIGRKDNFFEVGGDSLKAMQVITKLRNSGYSITVQNILQYQTVSSISSMMHEIDNLGDRGTDTEIVTGEVPFDPIQKLFLHTKVKNPHHFNLSLMLQMPDKLFNSAMEQAVRLVVAHHDMLRCRFESGKQMIAGLEEETYRLNYIDLLFCKTHQEAAREIDKVVASVQTSMNLTRGPLFTVTVIKLPLADQLHICIHHFIADAISTKIIAEDLLTAYYYTSNQEVVRLPHKTASFKDCVLNFDSYTSSLLFSKEQQYWETLNEEIGRLKLPLKTANEPQQMGIFQKQVVVEGVLGLASILPGSMEQILIAAISSSICSSFDVAKIAVMLESHGRYDPKDVLFIDRTVGWFTTLYPVVFETNEVFDVTLDHLTDQLKSIPNHGMGYLAAMSKTDFQYMNLPEVTINYLSDLDDNVNTPYNVKISEFDCGEDMDRCNLFPTSLTVNVSNKSDGCLFDFVYDQAKWKKRDIEAIFAAVSQLLLKLAMTHLNSKEAQAQRDSDEKKIITNLINNAEQSMTAYEVGIIQSSYFTDYPLTGIQKISYEMKSRNVVINIPLFDQIDLLRMEKCWDKVLIAYDVLRSSIAFNGQHPFIRIYEQNCKLPFLDASHLKSQQSNELIELLLEKMNYFEQDEMYTINNLSSKVLLVKVSEVAYRLLMTCSHLIFDRFSAEVLRNKIMDFYYREESKTDVYPYKNYYKLLNNQLVQVSEQMIIEQLDVVNYHKCLSEFYHKCKDFKLHTYIYEYHDYEQWGLLSESEMVEIGQKLFLKGMRFIFGEIDLPLLNLHLARKNSHLNLFEYLGEFLDVIPVVLSRDCEKMDDDDLQRKLAFIQKNDLYFSAMFYPNENSSFGKLKKLLNDIHKMKKYIFILNSSGILKSANNLVVDTEKYWIYYNVINVSVNSDGLFMNLPVYDSENKQLEQYLNEEMKKLLLK